MVIDIGQLFAYLLAQGGQQQGQAQPAAQPMEQTAQPAAQPAQPAQPAYQQDKTAGALSEIGGLLGNLGAGMAPQQDSWQFRLGTLVAQQAKHRMEDERNKLLMAQLFQQSQQESKESTKAVDAFNQGQSGNTQPVGDFNTAGPSTQASPLANLNLSSLLGLGGGNQPGGLFGNMFSQAPQQPQQLPMGGVNPWLQRR